MCHTTEKSSLASTQYPATCSNAFRTECSIPPPMWDMRAMQLASNNEMAEGSGAFMNMTVACFSF